MALHTPAGRLNLSWATSQQPASQHSARVKQLLEADGTTRLEQLSDLSEHLSDVDARDAFRAHAGVPAVIHVMAVNLRDKAIQTTGATLLATLVETDQAAIEIGRAEGVQALLDGLVLHADHPSVCRAAVAALQALTLVKENRETMRRYDTLERLIGLMERFMDDEALAESVPATVANLVFGCGEARVESGELGAVECFTKGLVTHPSSATVVAQCAFGIRNLVWECPSNLGRAVEGETIETMQKLLSTHEASLQVVTQILGAFSNMVSLDAGMRTTLGNDKEFFTDLFRIMASFVGEPNLCATVCFLLISLAEHDIQHDRVYARAIASHCKETASYATIVTGLEYAIRIKNKDAVAKLCHLNFVLCIFEDFRRDIGRTKLLEVAVTALREQEFNDEDPISKLLCGIRGVISGNDESKLKFKELGGFSVTLEVMKAKRKSLNVMLKCTQVLDNAADGQMETTEQLLDRKDEVISPLLAAMSDFADCAALQVNVCSMLVKIACISREEAAKLVQAGARPCVELAKSRHRGNPAVESLANQLLSLLVDNTTGREGRGAARGNAGSRLRSRSRTIQAGNRSRSRAEKSKSPNRMMKQARRALEAAKLKEEGLDGETQGLHRSNTAPVIGHKRTAQSKFSLEPVYE